MESQLSGNEMGLENRAAARISASCCSVPSNSSSTLRESNFSFSSSDLAESSTRDKDFTNASYEGKDGNKFMYRALGSPICTFKKSSKKFKQLLTKSFIIKSMDTHTS